MKAPSEAQGSVSADLQFCCLQEILSFLPWKPRPLDGHGHGDLLQSPGLPSLLDQGPLATGE